MRVLPRPMRDSWQVCTCHTEISNELRQQCQKADNVCIFNIANLFSSKMDNIVFRLQALQKCF